MDFTTAYCQTRRDLEEKTWVVTSQHAALVDRLCLLTGHNHDEFLATLDRCRTAGLDVASSRVLFANTDKTMAAEAGVR